MSDADFTLYNAEAFGNIGSRRYAVAAGGVASIGPGEPVVTTQGGAAVSLGVSNQPCIASDYVVGIAASNSTETASAAGVVDVWPLVPGQIWLITPVTAGSWDSQSEYDALVGDMVTWALSSGAFKLNATHSLSNGLIVRPLDIFKYPGKVAVEFRQVVIATN